MRKLGLAARVRLLLYALVLATVIPVCSSAAGDDLGLADPMNDALHNCLKAPRTKSTIDIRECYATAERAYEAHLTKTYAGVLKHVDPKSRALISASQEAWLAYRKRTFAAQLGPWSGSRGTYIGIATDEMDVAAVRQRLIELYMIWPGFVSEERGAI